MNAGLLLGTLIGAAAVIAGCGGSSSSGDGASGTEAAGSVTVIGAKPEPTYTMCTLAVKKLEFLRLMNGNLVFVAQANQHGHSAAQAITGLVEMLVVNGLDFEKLKDYAFDFKDGDYTFKAGDDGYTFALYFASDWEGHAAGEKIPYNVFDYKSYLTDVAVQVLPTPKVTYGHGPLYDLIDGDVSASGLSLSGLKVNFKVHAELISFALNSKNTYNGSAPREKDTLLWSMTTTPTSLPAIQAQFAAGGYGLLFDGTKYDSVYYGLVQDYGSSPALIKKDEIGYFWELNYQSTVVKDGTTFYQTGLASERQTNTTSYFCDAEHAQRIGVATHAAGLGFGTFKFEDGTEVPYGLENF